MSIRLIMYWILIFAVLFSYSAFVINGNQNIEFAYAQVVPQQFSNVKDSVFVEVNQQQSVFQNIINRLRRVSEKGTQVCQVSSDEFAQLSETRTFTVSKHNVNGQTVSIARTNTLSASDLQVRFPNTHCERLTVYLNIFLQFIGHVS